MLFLPTLMETFYLLSNCLLQGEKYLVLKKKYRQLLLERDAKHNGADGDAGAHASPARSTSNTAQWDVRDTSPPPEKKQHEEPTLCQEADNAAEVRFKRQLTCLVFCVCGRSCGTNWDDPLLLMVQSWLLMWMMELLLNKAVFVSALCGWMFTWGDSGTNLREGREGQRAYVFT